MFYSWPGPFEPPERSLPSRKITALSYSWTTCTNKILGLEWVKIKMENILVFLHKILGMTENKSGNWVENPAQCSLWDDWKLKWKELIEG